MRGAVGVQLLDDLLLRGVLVGERLFLSGGGRGVAGRVGGRDVSLTEPLSLL